MTNYIMYLWRRFLCLLFCTEQFQASNVTSVEPGQVFISHGTVGSKELWVAVSEMLFDHKGKPFVYAVRRNFFNGWHYIPEARYLQENGMQSSVPGAYPSNKKTYLLPWKGNSDWVEKMIQAAKEEFPSMVHNTVALHTKGSPFI